MLQYLFQKRLSLLSIACVLFAGVFAFSCTPEERANLFNQISNGSSSSQDGGSSQGSGDQQGGSPADPSGDFIGAYALDDGTGLTDMYFSFFKGTLSNYSLKQAGKKVVLAEGCLWNTSPNDFSMDNTGEYAIEKGTIYLNGVPYGAVSFSDNQMILAGKTYTRFADFKSERCSVITVEGGLERTCDYKEQVLNITVSVSRTIPSGMLQVESGSDWLVPGEYANGIYRFSVAGNPIHISRSAQVVFSYLEAETVTLSLCQEVNPLVKNLSASGSANSYVVSSAGTYSFRTTGGNSSTSVGTVSSAVVLWESYGTSTTPSVGSIINNVSYSSNTITFSTLTTLENGNAVIAAKDASGNILWSWHIWVCKDYDPIASAQEYYNNAGTMMDRNLGATSATPGDVEALGLLYQWGRKDPFLGSSSISSNTQAKSTLSSWPSAVSSNSSNGTIEYAVSHPNTFIGCNFSNYDWYYTGSSSTDNNRWKSSKTIYDPCPPGWRVPDVGSSGVWAKALGSSRAPSWDSTNKGMNFSNKFGSAGTIWYPAAGCLSYGDGSLGSVGSRGYWWSCTPSGSNTYYLYLYSNGNVSQSGGGNRAYGQSVRCLQE